MRQGTPHHQVPLPISSRGHAHMRSPDRPHPQDPGSSRPCAFSARQKSITRRDEPTVRDPDSDDGAELAIVDDMLYELPSPRFQSADALAPELRQ